MLGHFPRPFVAPLLEAYICRAHIMQGTLHEALKREEKATGCAREQATHIVNLSKCAPALAKGDAVVGKLVTELAIKWLPSEAVWSLLGGIPSLQETLLANVLSNGSEPQVMGFINAA